VHRPRSNIPHPHDLAKIDEIAVEVLGFLQAKGDVAYIDPVQQRIDDVRGAFRTPHMDSLTTAVVPRRQQHIVEARDVVEMMVGDEDMVDLFWVNADSRQLRGRPTSRIEQQILTADLNQVGTALPIRVGRWRSGP